MKSRFALTLLVVLGLMMSGTGATLAVDGVSNDGSAAGTVYPDERGAQEKETLGGDEDETLGGDEVAGAQQGGQAGTQATAGESDGSLPFTGFLAIPLLLGGVALLGTGAVIRLRTRHEHDG